MSMSNYFEAEILKFGTGQANALGTAPTPWGRLYTATPTEAGTGGTLLTSTGYVPTDLTGEFAAPTSGEPSYTTHAGDISFGIVSTPSSGEITTLAIWDNATAGNMLYLAPLLGARVGFRGVASSEELLIASNTLANGTKVQVEAIPGLALPTGLAEGTRYYVVSSDADSIQLSATLGGSAINLTADGAGWVRVDYARDVQAGDEIIFRAGSIVIYQY